MKMANEMTKAVFYIQYDDGSYTQTVFESAIMAKRAYNRYAKRLEHNVKEYGWEVLSEPMTLSHRIREKLRQLELNNMNERIKQLEIQSVFYNEDTQLWEFDREKFAELLIQECANVCLSQRNPSNLNYKPSEKFAQALKQHFGVK